MSDKITFYNCLEDVAKLHGFDTPSQAEQYGGEVDMYFIIVSEAAELYATSQYNKALEDAAKEAEEDTFIQIAILKLKK